MTEVGTVYGEALYQLAKEEGLEKTIHEQLQILSQSFRQEPEFLKLLSSPRLSKTERCQILDDSFRGSIHGYLLNFLKILTEKSHIRSFFDCCESFTQSFYHDSGILPVTAVTAVALTEAQEARLKQTLGKLTGKQIALHSRIDPAILGGVRLDYDGQRLDDTVSHRLDAVRDLLNKTVL